MPTTATIRRHASDFVEFCADALLLTTNGTRRFGDIWFDFQRDLIMALAPSLHAIARGKRPPISKSYIEWTKSCGKDYILGLEINWFSMYSAVPAHNQVGAVDRDNADDLRRTIRGQIWSNQWWGDRVDIQNYRIIGKGIGNAPVETEICASDVAGSHGARPLLLALNEVHAIPEGRWDFVRNCLDNAAKVAGLVQIITNAPIRDSECHKLRKIAIDSPLWFTAIHSQPSPVISAAELADAERRGPHFRVRRLFYGDITDASGDALRPEDIAAAFSGVPMVNAAIPDYTAIGGLDGAVTAHFCAFVIIGKNAAGRYRLLRSWVWRPPHRGKIDLELVESTIRQAWRDFRLNRIATDPAKVEYITQRLQREGIRIEDRTQSGRHLVEQCYSLIDNMNARNIDLPDCSQLEFDLKNLRVEQRSYGMRLVSDEGEQGHGDLASALSIALGAARDIVHRPSNAVMPFDIRGGTQQFARAPRLFGISR